jgi:hypothetical protein
MVSVAHIQWLTSCKSFDDLIELLDVFTPTQGKSHFSLKAVSYDNR